MKYSKRREGLKQRQKEYDSDSKASVVHGYRRPGSLNGPGPSTTERYRRGISTKRSRQAAAKRGAA